MRLRSIPVALLVACACAGAPSQKERERAEIHYNLGAEALRGQRLQDALKEFDEALAADPNLADAHFGRALVMEGFGKREEAEQHYRRAIELRPAFPDAHNNLGQLLAERGQLSDALVQFDEALSNMHYREPYIARCNKGLALYGLGRKEEGIGELGKCLKQNPRFCFGHRRLGLLYLDEGKPKLALESFEKYAQSCPAAADAWYQVGIAQLKTGDATKASDAFQRCVDLAREGDLANECKRSREMLQ